VTQIVEAKGLVLRYGAAEPAVRDLSFGVLPGEVFSLFGPAGAGKTTTLSALAGLVVPTAGDALVAGHSVRTEARAVKRIVGLVPQEIALFGALSCRQNLRFWGRMYGLDGAELRHRVEEVLDAVLLRDCADERLQTVSGGLQRRINLAAALLHRPQVVLMDMPTLGADLQSRRMIMGLVKALAARGSTVLYATDSAAEARQLSARIGIMDRGRLRALGTHEELTRLVGEGDMMELRLQGGAPAHGVLMALGRVPGVRQTETLAGAVRVVADDGRAALPGLVSELNRHGSRVTGVSLSRPDLEAVYLHLTGRAFGDGGDQTRYVSKA